MAKNKTKIEVTTVFDGELDATDVFVSLISQKYGKTNTKEYLAKKKELKYNDCLLYTSLETAGLIMRVRQGVGEPNRIYVLIPGKEGATLA